MAAAAGEGDPLLEKKGVEVWPLEKALKEIGFGHYQLSLTALVAVSQACDAIEVLVLSVLQGELVRSWDLTGFHVACISGSVFLGEMLGCFLFGKLADSIGRRPATALSLALVALAGLGSCLAQSWQQMAVLRGLVGLGVGGFSVPWDMLVESVDASQLEPLLLAVNYVWTCGGLASAGLSWLILPRVGWRWLLFACALPSLIVAPLFLLLRESPRFLLQTQRDPAQAKEVLEYAARKNGVTLPAFDLAAPPLPLSPRDQEGEDAKKESRWLGGLLSKKGGRRRLTLTLWVVWFGFGWTYYGIVLLVGDLFQGKRAGTAAGSGDEKGTVSVEGDAFFVAVLLAVVGEMAGNVFAHLGLRYWKLKHITMQWVGYLFTAVLFCLLALPGRFVSDSAALGLAMGTRATISCASFVTWVYTSTVYPTEVRGRGHSYASAFTRAAAMLTPFCANLLFIENSQQEMSFLVTSSASPAFPASFLLADTSTPDTSGQVEPATSEETTGRVSRSLARWVDFGDSGLHHGALDAQPLMPAEANSQRPLWVRGWAGRALVPVALSPGLGHAASVLSGESRFLQKATAASGTTELRVGDARSDVSQELGQGAAAEVEADASSKAMAGLGRDHENVRESPFLVAVMFTNAGFAAVAALASYSLATETKGKVAC